MGGGGYSRQGSNNVCTEMSKQENMTHSRCSVAELRVFIMELRGGLGDICRDQMMEALVCGGSGNGAPSSPSKRDPATKSISWLIASSDHTLGFTLRFHVHRDAPSQCLSLLGVPRAKPFLCPTEDSSKEQSLHWGSPCDLTMTFLELHCSVQHFLLFLVRRCPVCTRA